MISPVTPYNENDRLRKLHSLEILDTSEDIDYDHITLLASYISKMPVALITLVDKDRQWFKSKVGLTACETTRDSSFCGHAILNPQEILIIPDARKDLRFVDNPLTKLDKPVIFYAGVPLLTKEGLAMGSLCVIDHKPNKLNEQQLSALKNLGKQVERLFELRFLNKELQATKESLITHNDLLKDFAGTVSHDLKMPLANLIITSDILKKKYDTQLDDSGKKYLNYLKKSSLSMSTYITNILAHYESSAYNKSDTHSFQLNDMLEDLVDLLDIKFECEVHLPEENFEIKCNRTALEQIFLNLIGNSLKYNDKEHTVIKINAEEKKNLYQFSIEDNGRGIEKEKVESIFSLFSTIGHLDRNGEKGHGIGLSTVQKLVNTLGGTIKVSSDLGSYTEFIFTIAK
ncbi:sensor histidine kinase [Dokdonia sp. Hel_I_53]|uniref:sensor histidine kinase n=1 Tax=Dokdonia sp. Hel_I_53 TaxID=1566287 RepID=UPI00119A6213|nr:GAF domain-containing sensor histidine kinase [Dokdonia sp. Hel_I_53]TVZ51298.1 GAF sensor signal transduction histidine kinase [Dokdonia sp. Hel_I_53]